MRMKLNVFLFAFMLVSLISLVSAETDTYTIRWIVPVVDTTPPTFTNLANLTHVVNNTFSRTWTATDSSGVSCWKINDTINWNINCSGYLKNLTTLDSIQKWWLNLSVNDTIGNERSAVFYIDVIAGKVIVLRKNLCPEDVFGYYNENLPNIRRCSK